MKKTKFKIWHKNKKKWLDEMFYDQIFINPEGKIFWYSAEKGLVDSSDDLILVEWTEAKDRNGKEIYNGDLLKNFDKGYTWMVEWSDGGFSWILVNKSKESIEPRETMLFFFAEKMEIIGNIFENKELLEEKK